MAVASSTKISLGKGGEFRAISTAGTGTAPGATATFIAFPFWTEKVTVTARNLSTAVSIYVAFNPWITVLKTTNNMATHPTDYSNVAQDSSTATSVDLSSLDTVANGDWMLVGAQVPFRGVYFDVDDTNGTASCTGSVYYWNGAWTDTSATMSGVTSSTFLDQDGIVTWTVPTTWRPTTFSHIYPNLKKDKYYSDVPLYWTRWETDTALEASVTIDSMSAANRSTAYGELLDGQLLSKNIRHGFGGDGCIEVLGNAGTCNIHINAYTSGLFE